MISFELAEPRSVDEAVGLLDREDPSIRPIAGGTALMLVMKQKLFRPTLLVSLGRIKDVMRGIQPDGEGGFRVGAMTPLRALERSPVVAELAPVMAQALTTLSNVRVRNVATVGGHLAHGDPHMDLPPILLAVGARVHTISRRGGRWIELSNLYRGYYETSLERDELIDELAVPALAGGTQGAYAKFTSLSADDWPTLGVAVFFRREGGRLADVRVAIGAATEKPLRLTGVEALLNGEQPTEVLFRAAGDAAAAEVRPLADIRGTAAYKREMTRVFVRRALEQALRAQPQRGE